MPRSVFNWTDRRALAEDPKSRPEELSQAGRELLEAGRPAEAANFFARAKDDAGLALVRSRAVGEGDHFLYSMTRQLQGAPASASELGELASRAAALGLGAYEESARAEMARLESGSAD
ncbi:MAG: hypothetical protein LBO05_07695 [Deltaproteobacteria bacterium]|jgi:hypothetical protein|nr:hypothetical protein [Deltaproteobacteria bacterium]